MFLKRYFYATLLYSELNHTDWILYLESSNAKCDTIFKDYIEKLAFSLLKKKEVNCS